MVTKVDPSVVDDQVIGRKNIIINGDMKVYQRAQSVTGFTAAYKYYTADRMRFSSSGGTVGTWNQEVQTDQNIGDYSNVNVLKTTLATAGQAGYHRGVNYRVEPTDIKHMVGKTCTLSFYAKADATTTQDRIIYAISSGSAASTIDLGNITLTTSYTKYTASFTMPNCTDYLDITLRVDGDIETSSYITLIQLELGSQATPFEFKNYGEELALCQRYFYKEVSTSGALFGFVGFADNSTTAYIQHIYPVSMRSEPTVSTTGTAGDYSIRVTGNTLGCSSVPSLSSGNEHVSHVVYSVSSGLTGGQAVVGKFDAADVFLGFDAEL